MKVMDFNVRIDIEKRETKVDKIGNHTLTYTPFFSCYAAVSNESGGESEKAGQIVRTASAVFTIRWCEKLKHIVSDGYRVCFHGEEWNILSVDHQKFERKYIQLKCERTAR